MDMQNLNLIEQAKTLATTWGLKVIGAIALLIIGLIAAKMIRGNDNLHIIYITNFKCGPDSFIKHFVRPASGKPFLTLQFDGHNSDAGMMTRCEAYLDSKGVLRPWRREEVAAYSG